MEGFKNTTDDKSVNPANEIAEAEAVQEKEGIASKLGTFFGKVVNKITAMKKKTLIIICAAVVALLVGTITSVACLNSPKIVAVNAVTGFVEDFVERDELGVVIDMLDKGSLEMSMSKFEKNDEDMLDGASFSGKLYFGKDAVMLENLKISANDQKINASLYLSKDMIYVSEDEVIKEAFGAKFDELADDLKNSIFAYGADSDYAIPNEDVYNSIIELLENEDNEEFEKDAAKLLKDVIKDVYKIIYKNAEVEKENDKVKVNGDRISARVITITIDNKALADILEQLYEYLEKNDDIVAFLEKYEKNVNSLLEEFGVAEKDMSLVEMYEDFLDDMEKGLDDTCDSLRDKGNKFKFSVEIVTPKTSSTLLKLTVKMDKEELIGIEVGKKGIKNTDKITLSSAGGEIVYKIDKDNSKAYEAKLTVKNGDEKETLLSIKIDKKADSFNVVAGNITVKGDVTKKGNTTTVALKKIIFSEEVIDWDAYNDALEAYYDDSWYNDYPDEDDYVTTEETTVTTNLEIIIKASDKMPSVPKDYDTISDITEEDVESWLKKLSGEEK